MAIAFVGVAGEIHCMWVHMTHNYYSVIHGCLSTATDELLACVACSKHPLCKLIHFHYFYMLIVAIGKISVDQLLQIFSY